MAIELVTGHAGAGHVSSADVGRFNAGICGSGKYVLSTGSQFGYTIVSNNLVRIASGDAVNQGRHIIIPQNTTEDAAIQNGTQGKARIDVIALRYTKSTAVVDEQTVTIESASLVVIKGTEVAKTSTPTAPAVTSGNIFTGAAVDDMPLYHVLIVDTSISSVTAVFEKLSALAQLKAEMLDLTYPVGSIYLSVSSINPGTLFGGTWEEIQGKFLLGRSTAHAAGSSGGAETVILTSEQIPAHTHSVPAHTHIVPNHLHTVPAHTHTATCAEAGAHRHKQVRTQNAASGTARYAVQGTDTSVTAQTESGGAHKHTITVASKAAFSTASSGTCTTGSTGGTTGSTGSGSAVTVMPPFLSIYMWKRTA